MGGSGAALALAALLQGVDAPVSASPPADNAITPASVKFGGQRDINRCYDSFAKRSGTEGRTLVVVTIQADGSVGTIEFAAGIEPWQEATSRCVISLAKFTPATRNGIPVASKVSMPIYFFLNRGSDRMPETTFLKLVSTSDELEDAYRACYPPGELTTAQPKFRVTFSVRGKITEIELVESSGLEVMDVAGRCILERLKYTPAKRDEIPVRSTITMPLTVRPPT